MKASGRKTKRKPPRPPKHQRVRELLREKIAAGVYPPGASLPPETELPKKLRVSKITVVRALNDLAREGLIVRRRGRGSFVADPTQRPLIPGRFLRLGLLYPHSVYPDLRFGPVQQDIVSGVLAGWGLSRVEPRFPKVRKDQVTRGNWSCETRGCLVEVLGEERVTRLKHPPLDAVREGRFDGLLSVSIAEEGWIHEVLDLNTPTVLVDYPNERFTLRADQVFFDPLPGFRAAVRHLAARGLKRIHFVGCWSHMPYATMQEQLRDRDYYDPAKARPDPDSLVRLSAWRQAMDECDLPVGQAWTHWVWAEPESCRALARRLLGRRASTRPEAVVCHGLLQAERLVDFFAENGVSLEGAGASSEAGSGKALAICADSRALGRTAASLLLWKLKEPGRPALRVGVPMLFDGSANGGGT
jgi:DNA-binding LacI/PurR family transcriptional regulator